MEFIVNFIKYHPFNKKIKELKTTYMNIIIDIKLLWRGLYD